MEVKTIESHRASKLISKDYEYYDTIVKDLISEIKIKQNKKPVLLNTMPKPIIRKRRIN